MFTLKQTESSTEPSGDDWQAFLGHLRATLEKFQVATAEREDVIAFVESTRQDIVEA